ncbi:MAG: hypothetical protein JW818_11550 [Pirellulales bacterium]|nr:hypothetical protein [Pirellulales bacterium]
MSVDFFACLEQIAGKMDQARFSPEAKIDYNLFADALVWSDEYPSDIEGQRADYDCVKLLLRYRTTLLLGNPDNTFKPYWEAGKRLFPNWAGFHVSRVTPTEELRQQFESFHARGERHIQAWERLCQQKKGG